MKTPPPAELERLLNAAADGVIDDVDEQALAAWLKSDPAARQHYREFMVLHASLHWDYIQSALPAAGGDRVQALPETAVQRSQSWWRLPLAAAAVFIAVIAGWQWLASRNHTPAEATAQQTVAFLRGAVGAEWEDGARQPGQSLAPGWLRVKAGAVQIEFSRGARVLLEGPAELELLSGNSAVLRHGRLRATVPEAARGFTILGEGFSVVDHGTEFGVIAGKQREVHVFKGEVDVRPDGGASRLLAKADAVRMAVGILEAIPARTDLFMSDETFARLDAGNSSTRLAAWRKASTALSAYPAALVHYDFEMGGGSDRTLPNRAPGLAAAASIIGCEPALGRWPGKGALEFKRAEDRLRFNVPGEMPSLTLLAWVRVDGLPNTQSSLLMSESELPGDVHWYLHRGAGVGFAVVAPDGRWRNFHTGKPLRRELFGTWLFLAVTFDGASGTANHYFNGEPVASQVLGEVGPLRPGTVELGNWGLRPGATLRASRSVLNEPAGYVRNLQGRMDEFALLSTALSEEEILRLYQEGRPTAGLSPSGSR